MAMFQEQKEEDIQQMLVCKTHLGTREIIIIYAGRFANLTQRRDARRRAC